MLSMNEVLHNRYRITGKLGQGGMGAVYKAEDGKRFEKAVAVKEILVSISENLDLQQQELIKKSFEREAKILAGLEHEAFPQVIDYFVEKEHQFLVMELIQGENLAKLLEERQQMFPADEVLMWAEQLLDALDYLHTLEQPVYHRDIKPQNLKLTSRGRIKLLDFGIAKGADSSADLSITNHTFIAATLHYSPLEQIIKAIDPNYREFLVQTFGDPLIKIIAAKTDAQSDIYALGATLYHLLTNTLPVDALKRFLEIFAGNPDPLPNPQKLNNQIPPVISDWILKAMEIERGNRFAVAREMQSALRKGVKNDEELERAREEDAARTALAAAEENLKLEQNIIKEERRLINSERELLFKQLADKDSSAAGSPGDSPSQKNIATVAFFADAFGEKIILEETKSGVANFEISNELWITDADESEKPPRNFFTGEQLLSGSANNYTAASYFEDICQKPDAKTDAVECKDEISFAAEGEAKNTFASIVKKSNPVRVVALLLCLLFVMFSGTAGMGMWLLRQTPPRKVSIKTMENNPIVQPTVEPTVQPTIEPKIQPTVEPKVELKTKASGQTAVTNITSNNLQKAKPTPEKAKPTPEVSKTPEKKKKKFDPCQPVTADCIINDN